MFENRYFDLFVNLGSYKPKYVLTRLIITSISAIILIYITGAMTEWEVIAQNIRIAIYIITILAFISVFEINLLIIGGFKKSKKLKGNFYLHAFTVIVSTLLIAYFWVKVAEKVLGDHNLLKERVAQIVLIIGLLLVYIHFLIVIISNLTKEWIRSKKEIEELKQAKLRSDYNQLKDRLNPHFLFNNLSVLKSLIHYSPGDAEIFTDNFTNVYRYMLKCHDQKTVSLEEEIKFLNSYIALHKERIGEGLQVNVTIDDAAMQKEIPPMAVQLLVENAIKHNITSKNHPLTIEIYSEKQSISVRNNLNRKEVTYSTHTGLSSLEAQYKFISGQSITILEENSHFTAKVPLL